MARWLTIGFMMTLLFSFTGCGTPVSPEEQILTFVLVNQTSMEVDPNLYISESQVTAESLFGNSANMFKNFNGKTTLAANSTVTITMNYGKAVTIGSNQAGFGSLTSWTGGKSVESPVLRQGTDFVYPQTITFTFSQDSDKKFHTTAKVF